MSPLVIFALALRLVSALPSKLHPLSDEYIAEINSKQSTWKAGRNFEVEDYDLFKIMASGVKRPQNITVQVRTDLHDEDEDIPESFDSREAWPACAEIIGMIRDQSRCGSCWAFAAVESMSDRICIHSDGAKKLIISAQDLLTCGTAGGCDGGWPYKAWSDWSSGIVTGGLYEEYDQGCKSYFLPNCEDHPNKCTNYVSTPACVRLCDVSSSNYDAQETYGLEYYEFRGENQIQLEILKNGPVEATMDVYTDFANYKSGPLIYYKVTEYGELFLEPYDCISGDFVGSVSIGIYQLTTDDYEGGHAVKILGWGVEDDVKYWLVANSWNERWGENGYFRIIRGKNEVGIESTIDAALPDFSKF